MSDENEKFAPDTDMYEIIGPNKPEQNKKKMARDFSVDPNALHLIRCVVTTDSGH